MKYIKKYKFMLLFLLMVISFFTARLTITWDSAHYMSYVEIFEDIKPFSSWDIVRGPIFPLFIFIGDKLFGKNAIGLLTLIFFVYLIYCYLVYLVSKKIFKDVKYGKYFSLLFILFGIFNPLIFGYFHTLLTEFLAITLMVLCCYLSWKWIYIKNKRQKINYSLFFILSLPFSYFLKQPFICIVFIPLLVSIIICIIKNHDIKNVIYRFGTMIVSIIVLFIGVFCWNHFLIYKNVDMNTGRDSSSLLTGQLLGAVSNFDLSIIDDYSLIENDKSLSKKERSYAKRLIDNNKKILLIKIFDNDKLIESDLILVGDNGSSVLDVVKELSFFSVKHPDLLIESYSKNYCAISSICVIDSADGVGYWITNRMEFINLFENNSIAYKFLNSGSNLFYLSSEKYESAKYYEQIGGLSITSRLLSILKVPTNVMYKLVMVLMPFVSILFFVFTFIKRKTIIKNDLYYFGIIFLISSFLTTLISSSTGQIIDRYSVYCFIPGLIGIIACVKFCISSIKLRKDK